MVGRHREHWEIMRGQARCIGELQALLTVLMPLLGEHQAVALAADGALGEARRGLGVTECTFEARTEGYGRRGRLFGAGRFRRTVKRAGQGPPRLVPGHAHDARVDGFEAKRERG